MRKFIPPFIVLTTSLGLAELGHWLQFLNPSLIPAPSAVIQVFFEMGADVFQAFAESLFSSAAGFLLSFIVGICLAFVFSLSVRIREAILPFAVFFQTVPIIAIAPLLVIYFGFGTPTVVASAFIVSIFPVIANTMVGLESYNTEQLDLFKLHHASPWQILLNLKLPSAYKHIYSGLKISAGLSIVGVVAGEFVAGGGLGALIDSARTQQRVDIVFAALLLLALLGLLYLGILGLIHFLIIQRRPL